MSTTPEQPKFTGSITVITCVPCRLFRKTATPAVFLCHFGPSQLAICGRHPLPVRATYVEYITQQPDVLVEETA